MFRSLDHPQEATLFLAKVTSKTFIKFLYINRVLWQHDMLPQHPVNVKEFYECF